MAAKIDKEMLAKNQFWIGLGAFVLLWLIGVIVVLVSANSTPKTDYDNAKKAVDGASNSKPKTVAYQIPWNEHGKMFRDHKDVIWADAWKLQSAMYTWPDGLPVKPLYAEDKFGPSPTADADARGRFRTELYPKQFTDLVHAVDPVEFAGGFETVMQPRKWVATRAPTREEIWLAQEDFWVRREMLAIVWEALNAVRVFREITPLPKDVKPAPAGIVGRRRFESTNWRMDLLFEKDKNTGKLVVSDRSTLQNINKAGRTLPLTSPRTHGPLEFLLWQGRGSYPLKIAGEALPANSDPVPFKQTHDPQPVSLAEPFGVAQVLEWELSPVRRIDSLDVAYHSHRTVTSGLKVRDDLKKLDPEPAEETSTSTTSGQAPGGPSAPGASSVPAAPVTSGSGGMSGSGRGLPGMPGAGGPGGTDVPTDGTKINLISRTRYLHVKEQARHLPIAMRLVIDQAYINDVLAAVANSRLRIQITQLGMHQTNMTRGTQPATGSVPGAAGPSAAGLAGAAFPGMGPRGAMMGSMRPPAAMGGSDLRPGGGRGSLRPPSGTTPSPIGPAPLAPSGSGDKPADSTAHVQDTARLVELSVYGVATLYERFPPRSKDATPGTPGAAAAPPARP
jgi:hypothetical protein